MTAKEKRVSISSDSGSDSSSDEEKENNKPSNDLVVTKYNMAAEIVNTVLKEVAAKVTVGATVLDLCALGDIRLTELTSKTFKKEKNMQKGIAMPTSISIDNCICHFSPLSSDSPVELKEGQMVKIELGAHIDGFIATAAHTVVVGSSEDHKVKDKQARVLLAAHHALEAAVRMLLPSKEHKNFDVSELITKICKIYDVSPVENMISHDISQFKMSGEKQIILNPSDEQKGKVEKCTFADYEVYILDVLVSSGEGKAKNMDTRTTIYKKADDLVYSLKMKASREFFSKAVQKFGSMPFTLRAFEDEKKAKMGIIECEKHGLMQPYQVLYEREGEFVAQFQTTVIIMPTGLLKITGLPFEANKVECDVKIEDEKILALLKEPLKLKKKKTNQKEKAENASKPDESATKPAEKATKPAEKKAADGKDSAKAKTKKAG